MIVPVPSDPRFDDLTGRAFGGVVVLGYAGLAKPSAAEAWPTLSEDQERLIAESAMPIARLAREFGIARSRVYSIKKHYGLAARVAA